MIFAHDTEVALAAAAALINTCDTTGSDPDSLATHQDLDHFVRQWGFTGSRRHDAAELEGVRALRPRLRRLWTAQETDVLVGGINDMLASARALPQLVRHDNWDWHLHATAPEQPLETRMAVEAAMALVDVVRSGEVSRLRACDAGDCANVHIDLSKNRSRRYCGPACGNRAHVAAYRARKARAGDG